MERLIGSSEKNDGAKARLLDDEEVEELEEQEREKEKASK